MNGNEVIAAARLNFGEKTAATVTADDMLIWLNKAIQEAFVLLPVTETRPSTSTQAISFTAGRAAVPTTVDKVISLKVNDSEASFVPPPIIQSIDELGTYFIPSKPVWTEVGNTLLVRPKVDGSLDAMVTTGPPSIETGDLTDEIESVPSHYHPALVNLITSYAYGQEEDTQQAQNYMGIALRDLASRGGSE